MGTRTIVPSVCLAVCIALTSGAWAQSAVDPMDIVQFPATPPGKPAHAPPGTPAPPATSAPATQAGVVPLRSLPAVAAAVQAQIQTPWQDAAKQAENRLSDPALCQKLDDRLNALAPTVAAALLNQPGGLAVVSIAVYSDPATNQQRSLAVAFEGLDGALNPGFFPRLLADMPFPADQAKMQNRALAFDPAASRCMIYYLAAGNLDAADISQATLKQSLGQALAPPPLTDPAPLAAAAPLPADFPQRLPPPTATETSEQAQHAQDVQNRAISDDSSAYDASGIDTSSWGQPPVYTPHWITIDIPQTSAGTAAPAASAAPAARTTVGATPPSVGSSPKGKKGK